MRSGEVVGLRVVRHVDGRFLSNDQVDYLDHLDRGNPVQGFNRYTYANNNPYKYVDPDGEFINSVVGLIVGGTAAGIAAYVSGADSRTVALAIGGGALVGAVSGGTSLPSQIGAVFSAFGANASFSIAAGTVATGGISGAAGNAIGQVGNQAYNAAKGFTVPEFDKSQIALAGGLGAVGALLPGIAAAANIPALQPLSPGAFKALTSVTGFGASGDLALGAAAGGFEGLISKTLEQASQVIESLKDDK